MELNLFEEVFTFNPSKKYDLNRETRLVIYNDKKGAFSHLIVLKPQEEYKLNYLDLEGHLDYRYKYQVKEDSKWIDKINYQPIINEKSYNNIKYLFFPNEKADFLIVVFQAINRNPSYNYIKTLKNLDATRLYIKDDYGKDIATRTSYYLGEKKGTEISDSVIDLIEKTRIKLGIKKERVICAGSSKGGFAAMYHGYKGGYGNIVVGGAQVLLGNFLTNGKIDNDSSSILPLILEYIAGDVSKKSIEWANSILFKQIESSKNHNPDIYFHVGKYEPHYEQHAVPLKQYFAKNEKNNFYLDEGEYYTHSELAQYFPTFLEEIINKIITKK